MTRDYATERMSLFAGILCAVVIFLSSLLVKRGASFVFAASLVVFCVIFILSYAVFTIVSQGMAKKEAETRKIIFISDAEEFEFTPKVKAVDAPPIELLMKHGKTAAKKQRDLLSIIPPIPGEESGAEKIKESEKSKLQQNIEKLLQEASAGIISDEHPLKDKMDFLVKADPQALAKIIKGEWLSHGE